MVYATLYGCSHTYRVLHAYDRGPHGRWLVVVARFADRTGKKLPEKFIKMPLFAAKLASKANDDILPSLW